LENLLSAICPPSVHDSIDAGWKTFQFDGFHDGAGKKAVWSDDIPLPAGTGTSGIEVWKQMFEFSWATWFSGSQYSGAAF